jgi:spermidine synthase
VRPALCILTLVSGLAGLSWEILWQLQAALSLGVSARGTALTLVGTMGGMSVGAALAGRLLEARTALRPLRAYALLELLIGLSGLVVLPGFRAVETLSSLVWTRAPAFAPVLHLVGIVALLGVPTLAMGATIPVFGALARRHGLSLSTLYGLNTAGATVGVLVVSFVFLPAAGVLLTSRLVVCLNLLVVLAAWLLSAREQAGVLAVMAAAPVGPGATTFTPRLDLLVAFATGLVTFSLEVAWFRSLRAAFQSTVSSFALMLVSVLLPLAAGAHLAPLLRRRGGRALLGALLAAAGVAILCLTPLVERFDLFAPVPQQSFFLGQLARLGVTLVLLAPPVLLLGTALPWLLDEQTGPAAQGRLYAFNTAGAIAGSLGAAWLLLPGLGFARTAWAAGLTLLVVAVPFLRGRRRVLLATAGALALLVAVRGESGVGRLRVQSQTVERGHRVLGFAEGPDATVSVIEQANRDRVLVIDGFETTAETASAHYMAWMGRLPMLLHDRPRTALVICFGTGQTANAVREEGVESLDVVDLDRSVLGFAPLFPSNHNVLDDARVHATVMDGRAWLRRTGHRYDVVTLEPMSPEFAGSNALYSVEFYRLMAARLNPGAVVAQWVPFHIVPPSAAGSIVAAFIAVFPDALLWIDPRDRTGILLGRQAGSHERLGRRWPGLARPAVGRDLSSAVIQASVRLEGAALERYARFGVPVDDDNQLLAYGDLAAQRIRLGARMSLINLELVEKVRTMPRE